MFIQVIVDKFLLIIIAPLTENTVWAQHCAILFINIKSNLHNCNMGQVLLFLI